MRSQLISAYSRDTTLRGHQEVSRAYSTSEMKVGETQSGISDLEWKGGREHMKATSCFLYFIFDEALVVDVFEIYLQDLSV